MQCKLLEMVLYHIYSQKSYEPAKFTSATHASSIPEKKAVFAANFQALTC